MSDFDASLNAKIGIAERAVHQDNASANLWHDADVAMKGFQANPSTAGFSNLADKTAGLMTAMEPAGSAKILTYSRDSQNDQSATKFETLAAMDTGAANMWFASGTRINPTNRILAGDRYDLGGDAATIYTGARYNLAKAAEETGKHASADTGRIAEEQDIVSKQLSQIYGGHDVDAVYQHLLAGLNGKSGSDPIGIDDLSKFEMNLRSRVGSPFDAGDSQLQGKLSRDVALIDLALAGFYKGHGDAADAKPYYDSAEQYQMRAQAFDPKAADLKPLDELIKKAKF